jgi:hypothetical protein
LNQFFRSVSYWLVSLRNQFRIGIQGFDDQNSKSCKTLKLKKPFLSKIKIYLFLGLYEELQSYPGTGIAFISRKRTPSTTKRKLLTFPIFFCFCPFGSGSGYGSSTRLRIRSYIFPTFSRIENTELRYECKNVQTLASLALAFWSCSFITTKKWEHFSHLTNLGDTKISLISTNVYRYRTYLAK